MSISSDGYLAACLMEFVEDAVEALLRLSFVGQELDVVLPLCRGPPCRQVWLRVRWSAEGVSCPVPCRRRCIVD